ncbi:MAG: hypothetical protein F4Z51_05375 [Chloroflexi bacterium]|nr:hypothetical protein [Chloroflexota bacterium]MYD17798.1 hypothetical protein [Chloroflexota bacterium]MYJ01073.1 hypothetical protein [Chloroflexota bacterium]
MQRLTLNAAIYLQDGWYISRCTDLGIGSQGETIDHAREMLIEAVEMTLEDMSQQEYEGRLSGAYFTNSHITAEEILEGCELIESCSITVEADLPFVLSH